MEQKTSKLLYEYWNEVRKGCIAPERFEIEPSRIAGLLPETFIVDCSEPQAYSIRLAGTRICTQFGYELRGTSLLDSWPHDDREALESLLHNVRESGAVAVLKLSASDNRGRTAWFEMTLMPLVHGGDCVNRMLGSVTAIDPPFWIGTTLLGSRRLADFDLFWPDGPHRLAAGPAIAARSTPEENDQKPYAADKARRKFRVFEGGLSNRS